MHLGKSVLTYPILTVILQAIGDGATHAVAAGKAGVEPTQLRSWLDTGRKHSQTGKPGTLYARLYVGAAQKSAEATLDILKALKTIALATDERAIDRIAASKALLAHRPGYQPTTRVERHTTVTGTVKVATLLFDGLKLEELQDYIEADPAEIEEAKLLA